MKLHECQETITSYHETCHPLKSEPSEEEPIFSRDGILAGASRFCIFWSHLGCLGRKVTKYAHSRLGLCIEKFAKNAVTLTSQKSPLPLFGRLGSFTTHIGRC